MYYQAFPVRTIVKASAVAAAFFVAAYFVERALRGFDGLENVGAILSAVGAFFLFRVLYVCFVQLRRPTLVITEATARIRGYEIGWNSIESIERAVIQGADFVFVRLKHPKNAADRLPWYAANTMKRLLEAGKGALPIPPLRGISAEAVQRLLVEGLSNAAANADVASRFVPLSPADSAFVVALAATLGIVPQSVIALVVAQRISAGDLFGIVCQIAIGIAIYLGMVVYLRDMCARKPNFDLFAQFG